MCSVLRQAIDLHSSGVRGCSSCPPSPPAQLAIDASLTAAEADVARSMVAGLSNDEIASKRRTSCRTVANQAASVFRKLHVGSRRELAAVVSRRAASGEKS